VPRFPVAQDHPDFPPATSSTAGEPRQRGPLGERLTDAELKPIRVHARGDAWLVNYGSYAHGRHGTRDEAIKAALTAAVSENRELTIERPRRISETAANEELESDREPIR
jgi:hypothetical protein